MGLLFRDFCQFFQLKLDGRPRVPGTAVCVFVSFYLADKNVDFVLPIETVHMMSYGLLYTHKIPRKM